MKTCNPKRHSDSDRRAVWYPYYAGYAHAFVRDALVELDLKDDSVVLDPWNGSGTTVQVAACKGLAVVGFDINPALVLVAKARLLTQMSVAVLRDKLDVIVAEARATSVRTSADDGLKLWFRDRPVAHLRAIQKAIHDVVGTSATTNGMFRGAGVNRLSNVTAFFYLALFNTVREFLGSFRSSNPVWVRTAKSDEDRVGVDRRRILSTFRSEVAHLVSLYEKRDKLKATATVRLGDSTEIPLRDSTVDAVITSPPYCTRLDYAVATLPELAILGCPSRAALKTLRDKSLGTPTMHELIPTPSDTWGETCAETLDAIFGHDSKASSGYYHRYFLQYFDGLAKSCREIDRVLRPGGRCVIVVQDSYYKDVHVDLPRIVCEINAELGWSTQSNCTFQVRNQLCAINSAARDYREIDSACERVLLFSKPD